MAANRFSPIAGVKKLAFDSSSGAFLEFDDAWVGAAALPAVPANRVGTVPFSGGILSDASGSPSAPGAGPAAALAPMPLPPSLPTDSLFASQFHLRNTVGGERDLGLFRGDASAWDDYTGAGVHIGIIDDGIDYLHADLDANYDATRERESPW